jgi:hypothetical protein
MRNQGVIGIENNPSAEQQFGQLLGRRRVQFPMNVTTICLSLIVVIIVATLIAAFVVNH